MVGIVVVSHSEPLARSAVELATQMVGDRPPPLEIAAGNDGGLGTDAVAVAAAIQRADEASDGTGVLVITDLGSAVLSSEMALELTEPLRGPVLLSRAPFVEGLVAAVVQASMGRSLIEVETEAVGAAAAKAAQLSAGAEPASGPEPASGNGGAGDSGGAGSRGGAGAPGERQAVGQADHVTREVLVVNPQGLHARPTALLAQHAATLDAEVSVTNLETGHGPAAADSMLELMSLGVRQGNRVLLTAEGAGAAAALDSVAELIASGLGEGTGA